MMADENPSSDTFIPVQQPGADASGASPSMADTIKLALDQVKDSTDDEDAPADKPETKPAEAKGKEAKAGKGAEDTSGDGDADDKTKGKSEPVEGDDDGDDDQPEKKDAEGDDKPSDGRANGKIKPPERLLPDAKEQWLNVPRSVQRDVDNIVRDYEAQIEAHKQRTERYESLRPFDELARQNGRDLRESLMKLNQIENQMTRNPVAALDAILREIGPRKGDGSPVTLFDVAQHVINQGQQGYQQTIAQGRQQQQIMERDSEAERLRQENEQLKARQVVNEIEARVIAPFKAAHPRYDELKDDIAFFIKSGRIPEGLSLIDKLEAAYDMAERLNPSPGKGGNEKSEALDQSDRVESDSSGRKSIRTGPGSVPRQENSVDATDVKALIRNNLRKAIRA